jgi:hypothetical protein
MTPMQKEWIDNASYEELLTRWRFAPVGSEWFQGECGEYYSKVMNEKKKQCDHVKASKNVGWDN